MAHPKKAKFFKANEKKTHSVKSYAYSYSYEYNSLPFLTMMNDRKPYIVYCVTLQFFTVTYS
jgi:hypothetical protein